MAIVSLSFPDQMLKEMDQIQKQDGFTGRSELVRAAIRLLIEDSRKKDSISGDTSAVMVVTHDESNEAPITRIKHAFEEIVKTHIHNKITHNNCVEVFLLEGDGKRVGSMTREFQKEDKLKSVKLVLVE
jgi:CopG family transcriptional regulator, nickel-responsive regulator